MHSTLMRLRRYRHTPQLSICMRLDTTYSFTCCGTVVWIRRCCVRQSMRAAEGLSAVHYTRHELSGKCKLYSDYTYECFIGSKFEVFTAVTMKNAVFWDIETAVPNLQETHYVSATEPSQLMLCKIWGFHGGDYEECRLRGYRNRSA
jgi:hypothetical protein